MYRIFTTAVLFASCLALSPAALAQDPEWEEEPEVPSTGEGEVFEEPVAEGEAPPKALALDPAEAIRRSIELRKEELGKRAYAFCHDDEFQTQPLLGERRFCRSFDQNSAEACPEAASMCTEKKSWLSDVNLKLPAWLGWAILAAVLAGVLYAFFRSLRSSGWATPREEIDLAALLDDDGLAGEIQALPEAPSMAILRRAQQSFAEGKAEEAAVLLQLAMLRYFDDTGLVQFHPSRTNGEYLRAVRRHADLAALYRNVAHQTDRIRFGDGTVDRTIISRSLEIAALLLSAPPRDDSRMVAATSLALLIAVFLASGCSGCESAGKPFYSHRPAGLAALPALLRSLGLTVEIKSYDLSEVPADTGIVVLRTSAAEDLSGMKLDSLLDADLAIVVIDDGNRGGWFLPITSTVTATAAFGELFGPSGPASLPPPADLAIADEPFCGIDLLAIAEQLPAGSVRLPRSAPLHWDGKTVTSSASAQRLEMYPILAPAYELDGRVQAMAFGAVRVNDEDEYLPGCILVFHADTLTNASLAFASNAGFAGGLFASMARQDERILFMDRIGKGKAEDGIARSVVQSRLLPLIVHGGLWVGLLFLLLGAAFGPLRDPVRAHHKAFIEHVQAVGRHYAAAGAPGLSHAARALARLLVMRHRHEVRGGQDAGWQAVARHLAEKHGLKEEDVRAALRLGVEGGSELGTTGVNEPMPSNQQMLRTLSTLLTGKQRKDKAKRGKIGAMFRSSKRTPGSPDARR